MSPWATPTGFPGSMRPSSIWSEREPTCTSPRRSCSRARPPHAARPHLGPRFRQKLPEVPFGQGRPVWVDDPHLNLDYHVRQTALPAPGSDEQLRNLAARIFSQQLDRSKPLWELWLVEGMEDAPLPVTGKSPPALFDGVSGVDITTVLYALDREPKGPPQTPPP